MVDTAGLAGSYLAGAGIQTTQALGELGHALGRGPLTDAVRPLRSRPGAGGRGGLAATRSAIFGGAGAAFTVTGDRLGRGGVDANGGVDLMFDRRIRFGASGHLSRSTE